MLLQNKTISGVILQLQQPNAGKFVDWNNTPLQIYNTSYPYMGHSDCIF